MLGTAFPNLICEFGCLVPGVLVTCCVSPSHTHEASKLFLQSFLWLPCPPLLHHQLTIAGDQHISLGLSLLKYLGRVPTWFSFLLRPLQQPVSLGYDFPRQDSSSSQVTGRKIASDEDFLPSDLAFGLASIASV